MSMQENYRTRCNTVADRQQKVRGMTAVEKCTAAARGRTKRLDGAIKDD
jgi:aspartate ammonia-lyase